MVAFCFKEPLFYVVFWPTDPSFPLWQLAPFNAQPQFINTELTQQFIIHMKVAFCAGFLCVSPYLIFLLVQFVRPALYPSERKAALPAVLGGVIMFLLGILLAYFLIFPFTYRFLSTYQVTAAVENIISLDSYISMLVVLSLLMGAVFELPVLCGLLAKMGLLTADPMRRYRRHALLVIVIISAIITPTGDAFTLSLVSVPIYLLYELSIGVVRFCNKKNE